MYKFSDTRKLKKLDIFPFINISVLLISSILLTDLPLIIGSRLKAIRSIVT